MGFLSSVPPRRWLVRTLLALIVVGLLAPSAVSGVQFVTTTQDLSNLRASVDRPANGLTVVAIQGFHFKGQANPNKPARLVAVGPRGDVRWVHNGSDVGARWFYDVDPLADGDLLVTATRPDGTLVYRLDPTTGTRLWTEKFDIHDTHDVDLINGDELLVANMRVADRGDRIFVYDRTRDEITWEWRFADHYPESVGASPRDWTHVNDVDKIGEGRYLVSPRNFDQVIVVNRSTNAVEMRLGADENYDVLYEQHNPQYLESENGTPTILVADSENDRVVEYAKDGENWTRTWTLGEDGGMNWPRDADRLPNGNTLVADTMHQRVFEVTPTGDVVWEFYAPWAPYDVERVAYGDEAGGPTMRDLGTTGTYSLHGGAGLSPGADGKTVSFWLYDTFEGTPLEARTQELARWWGHVMPWVRPVWLNSWEFLWAILGGGVLVGWLGAEGIYQRRRIWRRLTGAVDSGR